MYHETGISFCSLETSFDSSISNTKKHTPFECEVIYDIHLRTYLERKWTRWFWKKREIIYGQCVVAKYLNEKRYEFCFYTDLELKLTENVMYHLRGKFSHQYFRNCIFLKKHTLYTGKELICNTAKCYKNVFIKLKK